MDHSHLNHEPVAHMIDVEPVMVLGCSATEIKYVGVLSVLAWAGAAFLILLVLSWPLIIAPVIGLCFGIPTAIYIVKWIGKKKFGKPHLYYIHKLEVHLFSKFRACPFVQHEGVFRIGRSRR